jgi:flagellin FlaB
MFRAIKKGQRGITGLETAIILIAFVMVASVLSYVVLSAGLYSSQKAKEAVNSGLQQSNSTLIVKGNVLADTDGTELTMVYLTLGMASSSGSVDFTDTADGENVVVVSYSDTTQQAPAMDWTATRVNNTGSADFVITEGDLIQIAVDMSTLDNGVTANTPFTLEVKPPDGAVLTVQRKVPAKLDDVVNLQ